MSNSFILDYTFAKYHFEAIEVYWFASLAITLPVPIPVLSSTLTAPIGHIL
jgi:hypothetical protein